MTLMPRQFTCPTCPYGGNEDVSEVSLSPLRAGYRIIERVTLKSKFEALLKEAEDALEETCGTGADYDLGRIDAFREVLKLLTPKERK